ncbi:GLPGLI family protein [Polaribacter litorisediminis]|uniref:GLPGLI family protein n=1 Tax=Polaribacter litorisediminis TaxID=1908341 RepID=UPI001CBC947C|nr:GLPGLI family protein [Polaribacter litorisediminis]UAM98398.1 GLPGLI family protein [Polaribacter litorisediminis]
MRAIITTLALVFATALSAQNFNGKATYKTSRKSNIRFGDNQKGVTDKMQEELQKRMQKMNQKTFILEFDKTTSMYKEDVKLDDPTPRAGSRKMVVMSFGGSGSADLYYKDIKENRFANKTEIMGKPFLVKDALEKYEWELSSETKSIGTYTCYKATFSKEVENINMSMINGESKETKTTENVTTTAWYTTEVPISNGPADYQGLPGLILEINDGKNLIVCTEIILNPEKTITIEEPTKGKEVSKKKFDKIQKQKNQEMMEKMKGRKGIDLGNGINIKMGG